MTNFMEGVAGMVNWVDSIHARLVESRGRMALLIMVRSCRSLSAVTLTACHRCGH